jgi:hypothetical protein
MKAFPAAQAAALVCEAATERKGSGNEKGNEKGVRPHLPERPSGSFAQMRPDPFFVVQLHEHSLPDCLL